MLSEHAVVVTGAGGGLGRAYALLAAQEGAAVVVNDVIPGAAASVADEINAAGGSAVADSHSVSDWSGAEALINCCVEAFGRLDGLVNNAGISHAAGPGEENEQDIRAVVDVNLLGTIFCSQHAVRRMVPQKGGSIVNIASTAVWGAGRLGVYGATKGAVASMTYCWAIDLAQHGVRVNVVSPFASSLTLKNWAGVTTLLGYEGADRSEPDLTVIDPRTRPRPENNAPAIIYLLARSTNISGQFVQVHGNRLSVLARPTGVDDPPGATVSTDGEWSTGAVAAAFDRELAAHLQPVRDYRDPL